MKKLDIGIIALLLAGGMVAIFLDDVKPYPKIVGKKELLYELTKEGRYITTDEVAEMIMKNDPSLLLIDVRTPAEFEDFNIEGAINIPFEQLMNKENEVYFDNEAYVPVLYSNGTSLADKASLLLLANGYKGHKVMKGGLNTWVNTIINPRPPDVLTLTKEKERQYLFRKAAQIYFTGIQPGGTVRKTGNKTKPAKPVIKKRKKKEISAGCG
jgi:rhodanese-related sulfurtransferase